MNRKTTKESIERSIKSQWENLNMKAEEKTYFIFEHLYRVVRINPSLHVFTLKMLIELNQREIYDDKEEKKEILKKLNKALNDIK